MSSGARSPFKKLFESEKQEDGRVLITYKKKNLWFGPISAFFVAFCGSLLAFGIAEEALVKFPNLLNMYISKETRGGIMAGAFFLSFPVFFYLLAKIFFYRKRIIEIVPGVSITSNNVTVPVNDIDSMSVQGLEYHFILVSGHGKDIIFAGPILGESLAISIKNVIEKNINKKQITGIETR